MEEYDVIIAGAGPAGGNCARELSKMEHSVLLLEASKIIGEPNFSSGGTPIETMETFNLPKKVTDSPWKSLLIAGPTKKTEFLFDKKMGYVLNYQKLKQYLAKKAEKHGAEIKTGTRVKESIIKNGKIFGVVISENGIEKEVFAKIVVDATGSHAILAQRLGLVKKKMDIIAGIEYTMKNVIFQRKERLDFYLGPTYIPYGYAWIFPAGGNRAKVGMGYIVSPRERLSLLQLLKKFVKSNNQTREAVSIDLHGGSLFANGGIKNHVLGFCCRLGSFL